MAFENDQNESALPTGPGSDRKRKSADHLPRYYRTQSNTKFLSSTLDQLIQPGVVEQVNGYVGRKNAKAFTQDDNYVADVSAARENYQFEPAAVIKDNLNNIKFYKDYNDYINQLSAFNKGVQDHSILNQQEYYAWEPHIDWDKFSNFREYYWLPNGPQSVPITGNTVDVESNVTVTVGDNVDNNTYLFSNAGTTNNPTITLYRGQTYRFEVDTPNLPFTVKTQRTLEDDFNLDSSSILVLEGENIQNLEQGTTTLRLGADTPDILYYVASNDINAAGTIIVKDIEEATFIDVESEILGKRYYKTSTGFSLSNGMKVYFTGDVEPATYSEGAYYVEGVGSSIKLVPETNLNVPSAFTDDIVLEFDNATEGFDKLPYGSAIGYAGTKDYFVINRSSQDGNLWSRYNRWFHRSVIEESAAINDQPVEVNQSLRAKRPIIEFTAGLKLANFGTFAKSDVDLVDNFTTDVFSVIEGSPGYNIDGIDIVEGMRILFTADTDILVKGRIFEVDFINFASGGTTNRQVHLKEVTDTQPLENEVVLVKDGTNFKGKLFYFQNEEWKLTQDKTDVNQAPYFDIFDELENSYGDTNFYSATNFIGTKLFSYQEGTGSVDSELGLSLNYRSIENVGDILFDFNLLNDSFTYTVDNNIFTKNTDIGFLRIYNDRTTFAAVNGWTVADSKSDQPVIRQYVFDNSTTGFEIDVYEDSGSLADLWIRVYLNNDLTFEGTDYNVTTNSQGNSVITFINDLNIGDVIIIKTKSDALKTENGFYEVPINLERNPLNENLSDFTLGEVNDHVSTIVESTGEFAGSYPGTSNLRDLGPLSKFGRRFVQHSAPVNLSLYHLLAKDSNIIKSISFAKNEYAKFKRQFLIAIDELGFDGPTKEHVDRVLREINKAKTDTMPFYFSDMVPVTGAKKNTYIVDDVDFTFFGLSETFLLTQQTRKAVQVYQNGSQLIYNKDYTFNADGFCVITATKQLDDVIEIYEYENTNGSYVPPTPTKLGLYPKYEPQIYIDDTYQTPTKVIQGHDGSLVIAYDDFRDDLILELEKRIFNNLKVEYDASVFDIYDTVGGEYRNTKITRSNLNKPMLGDFVEWSNLIETDYTLHNFFDRTNRFTFNYKNLQSPSGKIVPGFWRQIYKEAYDTDRPHTHPWEMLGFSIQPKWWEEVYGPAPYTKDNLILWQDLEGGIVREPNKKIVIKEKYKRTNLTSYIPTDEQGNLLPPIDSGYIRNFTSQEIDDSFVFGDGAPVESAWRRSSEYPFSIIKSLVINQPSKTLSTAFDRIRQTRNKTGQIVYSTTNKRIRLEDIIFPNTASDTTQVYNAGLINYVAAYMSADVIRSYNDYKTNLTSIKNQIGFKIGGFTDKDKFRLILDSRTPLNEGNVFVPDENYQIFLNTSSPIETVSYSGVIVERRDDGYVIKGYDRQNTSFTYHRAVSTQNDPSINIGGISEPFLTWAAGKQYITGTNVGFEGSYYRVKTAHTSGSDFDSTFFAKLPALPLLGGREAFIRKTFIDTFEEELHYGTLIPTVQGVVDFLLGYGSWLESKGFVFDYFDGDSGSVLNWRHSVNEFLFWTTQNWSAGSVIALSPGATRLKFQSEYSTVDNIFDTFYGYTLLKSDGNKLVEEFSSLGREPNEFILQPKNTEDGIYSVRLPLIQKEHVCLIDNKTVFGDVIYDLQPGYRQERLKVLGYRTDNWDGSLNIPGFIYDNALIEEWESWKDYAIGDVVKYKEFYYSASKKVPGQETFVASNWNRLAEKPVPGLYANFEYKTNQFADFYDLDSDNFDTEQQRLAQHLIGYQKRDYLENIINDSVSQYKFYQGMIADKGTENALTKLFDALASDDKDSLEFYEEWAIKDGQYGASDGFAEIEYKLDESKFRLTPQPIELVNSITGNETDLIYRILPYETYVKDADYDHSSAFPSKNVLESYVKNAGYVNPQDVLGITTAYSDITNFFYNQVRKGAYIWVGNDKRSWNVYKHIGTPYTIESVESITGGFTITLNSTPNDIVVDDVIGIGDLYKFNAVGSQDSSIDASYDKFDLEGFFVVNAIQNNKITLTTDQTIEDIDSVKGSLSKFINVRAPDAVNANTILQQGVDQNDLIWIDDNGQLSWNVLENTKAFAELQFLNNSAQGNGHSFGNSLSADDRNITLLVGAPDYGDGKVYVYSRPANSVNFVQTQVIEPFGFADAGERFGASVAVTPDGEYALIGSPNASNVKTKYDSDKDFINTRNYSKGSIVRKDETLWQSLVDIQGQEDNIVFNSFGSTTQAVETLSIENDTTQQSPVLLVGNYAIDDNTGLYAFPNQSTDHFLVRVPIDIYEGSGQNDEVKLGWNKKTYSNQFQSVLTDREPFNGDYPLLTGEFLEQTRTVQNKVDAILYINAATNIPFVGDRLQTGTGNGEVSYVFSDASETVIYLSNTNGSFNIEDPLFRSDGDFIGQYVKQAPVDDVDTSDVWGGYWMINISTPYVPTTSTNTIDEGKAVVFYDVIPDSTATGRYYFNSLDLRAGITRSQNTIGSLIQILSFNGAPGPGEVTGDFLSNLYVVRSPKTVTDAVSASDQINLYVNQLPRAGVGIVKDLADINLNTSITNKKQTIYDVWDGYINFDFTIFDAGGNVFEPRAGLLVRDKTRGGTAEITFYQRNGNNVTIFVKNVTGDWSLGDDFGQNAEIEYTGNPANDQGVYNPSTTYTLNDVVEGSDLVKYIVKVASVTGVDPTGPTSGAFYDVDRTMGQIQFTGLGYAPANIGGLLVFEAPTNITIPATSVLLDVECWFYNESEVEGIPRPANIPSPINNEWKEIYKIPADNTGSASGLTNEGLYSLYQRSRPGIYDLVGSYTVPEQSSNMFLGNQIHITKFNDLYRAFIHAKQDANQSNPGRIYTVKDGTENGITYDWEYGKNKKFRGAFSESINYYTGDIVYLDNPSGILYTAKTNVAAGIFDPTDWTSTDDVVDYVGYMPNNTSLSVINDSTILPIVLDQTDMYSFGSAFDVSKAGDVLVTTALYDNSESSAPNRVVVYRSNNGFFERRQEILAPTNTSGFGQSISISDDGMMIAIGAPYDDDIKLDQGVVYVYKQNNGTFELAQTLNSPNNERAEMFGWNIEFDGGTLAVNARNADSYDVTSFDFYRDRDTSYSNTDYVNDSNGVESVSATTFDNSFTSFKSVNKNSGVVYLYENYNGTLLYGQIIQVADADINYFGRNLHIKNNHVYVGLPSFTENSFEGKVFDFRKGENDNIWSIKRSEKPTVDLDKIKKIFLYNTKEKELLTYLDFIDPLQGKVAGIAEQDLRYKTYYDPATYSTTSNADPSATQNIVFDRTDSWGKEHVGEVWWNLSTAKFYNPYQDSVIYSTQNWNKLFLGNNIDVYEWVESDVVPSVWDERADTNQWFPKGYSGTTLYGNDAYSTKTVYDSVAQSFKTKYYFWVENKKIIPNVEFRNIKLTEIKSYIEDPQAAGLRYVSLISPTQFVLYNCEDLIKDADVALSVQYWTIDNQKQNIHNQYQIISDGLETSQPKADIIRKWVDSLVGYDEQKRPVPDPALSPKYRYGILNNPRQGWFVNRIEALKQYIERTNDVLLNNLIIDDKDISNLFENELAPSVQSREYDAVVDTLDDLEFIGVARAARASLTPVIENGKLARVIINNSGRGYRVAPTFVITGNGEGAEIEIEIDGLGQISNAIVVKQGNNYDSATTITVRRFTVLVESDSSVQGKWALYERVQENIGFWNRIQSQAYDASLFWDYTDWYATGYSDLTEIDYVIDNSYELTSLENNIGTTVKISSIGSGGWLLLEKIDDQDTPDYTINYKTIGRQNGTIQFKTSLYDYNTSNVGFDTISYDTKIYDNEPVTELRIILNAIKNDLLIDDLLIEFNKLFFASLRYVYAEQPYVDWVFKTSFIKAKHNVGNLREDITFNNDNLPSYEAYVKEVKPFATKIREYLSAYEGLDNTRSVVTDFDLAPKYDSNLKKILPESIKIIDNNLIGIDADFETYPNKNWLDNSSFKVVSVDVVNAGSKYLSIPELIVEGGGGTGARLQAFLGRDGKISSVKVINGGTGYYSSPTVTINGNLAEDGVPATLSVKIGDSPVRQIHTVVKFDRTTGTYLHTTLTTDPEEFIGSGNKYAYNLVWPMDTVKSTISVTVNNIELLESEYSYSNVLDNTKGYDRYYGQVTFTEAPAVGDNVVISYKKNISLLQAQDRINTSYTASEGQFGKDLGQLMDGIDYGGVEVKSFAFGGQGGWDDGLYNADTWDTNYDTSYEDEVFEFDGSTIEITLSKPLEDGVVYNVYYQTPSDSQPIRIDDPNFDGSTVVDNPNARIQSFVGDGITQTLYMDDFKLEPYQEDGNNDGIFIKTGADYKLIIRKSTSDGTFDIDPEGYDTILSGGNLNYSTATGLAAEDIVLDGDGFVTPTTSGGPEELIPGQILDTVDIKVYERPKGGTSPITSRFYFGDGSTKTFDIGSSPILSDSIFVKVGFEIKPSSDYTVDYNTNTVTFTNAPENKEKINIITLGVSGTNILDIDEFIADGSTVEFLTNVRWSENLSYYITIDGEKQENVVFQSDETYAVPNNVVLKLATPPASGSVIRFAFFENTTDDKNFSEVLIDNFIADGSTTSFNLSQTPFTQKPLSWFTVVKVNNKILNAGYNKRFSVTASKLEYKLDEWQVPPGSIQNSEIKVFLNGIELEYIQQWTFIGNPSTADQDGSLIRLQSNVGQQEGDILDVYIISDGEYRFGTFNADVQFIETPGILQLDSAYNDGDTITVYQFSNHDSQGFERQQFDVVDRFNITNLEDGSSIPVDDATFPEDWYQLQHLRNGLIELREEAIDAQYVWVTINGDLLTPSVDYYVTENKRYVKINATILENDTIEVIQFSNPITANKLGWRQFKDMLNRTHYKRLDGTENIILATDLNWYDNEIVLIDADSLVEPQPNSKVPSVIFLEGERIEYFIKDGNTLKQLRRGTLGTGVKDVYLAGTEVYNQSQSSTIPYKDETITTVLTADGTSSAYQLDFMPNSVNEFEVFVAGRRLRKNTISSYVQPNPIAQDSPEGDITLEAEFSIEGSTLTLLEVPDINQKIIIVRRQGKLWSDPGTALADADTDISRFLRAKSPDLPR